MKTEINSENKAKFFAHNIGAKAIFIGKTREIESKTLTGVAFNDRKEWVLNLHSGTFSDFFCIDEWAIALKPLSSITDEDQHHVFKQIFQAVNWSPELMKRSQGNDIKSNVWEIIAKASISHVSASQYIQAADYLRSKGYALDWMGLSVEEMEQAGWLKTL